MHHGWRKLFEPTFDPEIMRNTTAGEAVSVPIPGLDAASFPYRRFALKLLANSSWRKLPDEN
jgi:hypothetical protein